MSGTVVVVGAGLVGLACARALQRDGFSVTVVDRGVPGHGASFGNASHMAIASVIPQATPGILRQTVRLLRDPQGPLIARKDYVARHLPWFARFLANGRSDRMRKGSRLMADLLARSWTSWQPVLEDAGCAHLVRQSGALHVFATQASLKASRWQYELRRELGVECVELDAGAAREIEPSLAEGIAAAVHVPGMGFVSDTLGLSEHLAARIVQAGGRIVQASVQDLDARGALTDQGRIEADLSVLAAGAWSAGLAARLGLRIPLVSERGYHVMRSAQAASPSLPLLLMERKVAVTPMAGGIRLASIAEFAPPDAPADHARAAPVFEGLNAWSRGLDGATQSRWVGPRPSVPDSRPILGRAPRAPHVLLACGHGHLGVTLAALTGEVIADLACGRDPRIDLAAVSPTRF